MVDPSIRSAHVNCFSLHNIAVGGAFLKPVRALSLLSTERESPICSPVLRPITFNSTSRSSQLREERNGDDDMLARMCSTRDNDSSDYSLAAGVLMAKEAPPTPQQQQLKLQKLQKRRRHSISTTVYHTAMSAVIDANTSTIASLSTTVTTTSTTVNRTGTASRTPASVTGLVTPMPSSSKVQASRRTSYAKANGASAAAATSPNKHDSQRRTDPIPSALASNSSSRANVLPLGGNRPNDAPLCSHSSFSSSASSSSCLSSSSPVQVLIKQQPSIRSTRESSQSFQQELPILRSQYIARDVKVLIGTRWKLKKFETRTVVLCANGSATPILTICSKTPVEKDSSTVKFNLALDLTCVHSGTNGLKLKSSTLRMKIRFTTAADAAIWFNLIHDTMRHARWIKDVEETACLSRDATATVLVARHVPTDKEFVIKVLPKVRVDDGACTEILVLKKLFRAVAATTKTGSSSMTALQHVLEYRVVETLKDVRIVMPKLPGKNLLQFLQQQQVEPTHKPNKHHHQPHHTLSEADAQSVLLALCESLHALHAIGIVHCDLKLENILLTDVSNVRVIDFGGAYDLSSADSSPLTMKNRTIAPSQHHRRKMIGTPGYIAPERILFVDEPPTSAADVFSIGIVLFQMLTGRQPFTRSSRHRVLSMQDATVLHWKSAEKILSSHGVSPAVMQLIERMVEPDPRSRITVEAVFCHPWLCC